MALKLKSVFRQVVAFVSKLTFYCLCPLISSLLPVRKGTVVVGSWSGDRVDDNIFGIHRSGLLNGFDTVYFLTNDPVSFSVLPGWTPLKKISLRAFWVCMSAELAIYCNNKIGDINGFCITKKTRIFNVWHGSPIKKVGEDKEKSIFRSRGLLQSVFTFLSVENETWVASSSTVAGFLSSAYGVPTCNFIIRKPPRFERSDTRRVTAKKIITIAPTFRANLESEELFFQTVFKVLSAISDSFEYDMRIFLHPYSKITKKKVRAIAKTYDCRVQFPEDKLIDVLASSILLISDFSSVIIDACQLKIPNISYASEVLADECYLDLRQFDHVLCTKEQTFSDCVSVLLGGVRHGTCFESISEQQNVLRSIYCAEQSILPQDLTSEEICV